MLVVTRRALWVRGSSWPKFLGGLLWEKTCENCYISSFGGYTGPRFVPNQGSPNFGTGRETVGFSPNPSIQIRVVEGLDSQVPLENWFEGLTFRRLIAKMGPGNLPKRGVLL